MNRKVALDLETTGLHWNKGDKIVEIGCVELLDDKVIGQSWHSYVNPNVSYVSQDGMAAHGLTLEFLVDKPLFKDVYESFRAFIKDSPLLIHNSHFDFMFLLNEAKISKLEPIKNVTIDTAKLARIAFPNKKINLDAICKLLMIKGRSKVEHSALEDAMIVAKAYPLIKVYTKSQEKASLFDLIKPDVVKVSKSLYKPIWLEVNPNDIKLHKQILSKLNIKLI